MEEEFKTTEDVQKWLAVDRNVPAPVAAALASTLFEVGYVYPSSLLNIQREDLGSLNISPPHRNILFNKLQQQQQNGEQQQPHRGNETPRKRSWGEGQQEGWTPGASKDVSRKAAQSFVEEVSKTGFSVFVNGGAVEAELAEETVRHCGVSTEDMVVADLGLTKENLTATPSFPDLQLDVKAGLVKYGETDFQKSAEFQQGFISIQAARVLDNSDASAVGPFYKPPQSLPFVGEAVYEKTAKADATSTIAPMDFEMKGKKEESPDRSALVANDWLVLKQAVERSRVRLHLAGYLGLTVTFAVTNRSAWCLIGKRHFPSRRHCVEQRFWRILHTSITRLWMGITRKATQSPFFFMTRDGPMIWNALDKIGVPPWSCRVKLLDMSQSNVYGVSLADDSFRIDAKKIDYALKVVREDQDNYSREVEALQTMANTDSKFYAIGHVPGKGKYPVLFNTSNSWKIGPMLPPAQQAEHAWWRRNIPAENLATGGGVIFMKYGYRKEDSDENVCRGVCYSLQAAHGAGILHCDIRKSNVLFFEGEGWRLIDFGLSCKTNDENAYDLEKDSGAQASAAGPRVTKCLANSEQIQWTVGDDYEMTMKMFGLLRSE